MSRKGSTRQFLKRGSRQHLSSALNRSKPPKQQTQEDDLNRSGISKRDLTPRNNRSVSQNRVLGKRNDEKGNTRTHANSNASELSNSRKVMTKPPLAKGTGKKEPTGAKPSQKTVSPANSRMKKTKNVFNDDSESSESSSEPEPVFQPKKQQQFNPNSSSRRPLRPNVFQDEPDANAET